MRHLILAGLFGTAVGAAVSGPLVWVAASYGWRYVEQGGRVPWRRPNPPYPFPVG